MEGEKNSELSASARFSFTISLLPISLLPVARLRVLPIHAALPPTGAVRLASPPRRSTFSREAKPRELFEE